MANVHATPALQAKIAPSTYAPTCALPRATASRANAFAALDSPVTIALNVTVAMDPWAQTSSAPARLVGRVKHAPRGSARMIAVPMATVQTALAFALTAGLVTIALSQLAPRSATIMAHVLLVVNASVTLASAVMTALLVSALRAAVVMVSAPKTSSVTAQVATVASRVIALMVAVATASVRMASACVNSGIVERTVPEQNAPTSAVGMVHVIHHLASAIASLLGQVLIAPSASATLIHTATVTALARVQKMVVAASARRAG